MESDLVIFEDLPSQRTPLNAYNLNHNFDVFKKDVDTAKNEISNTLEEIETSKAQMEQTITEKTTELETNITSKTQELESNITSKTNTLEENITIQVEDLENNITTKTTQLEENITQKTNKLESDINSSKTQLETEIGEAISKITTIKTDVVTELPTENIDTSTIYFIKPGNLPQSVSAEEFKISSTKNKIIISPKLYGLNGAEIQAMEITEEDYYLACFYVNQKWIVIGSSKIDLSDYPTLEQLTRILQDYVKSNELTKLLKGYAQKNEIPTNVSQLTNDSGYISEEADPTVPSHVKSISEENISSWNNKADTSAIPTNVSDLTNDMFVKCESEEDALSQSTGDTQHLYYWVEE